MPSVAMNPVFEELASSYYDVLFLTVDVDNDDVKEHKAQRFIELLTKLLEKLQEIDDICIRSELEVISYVLREAREVLNFDQSKSEECCAEDGLRMQECIKQADNPIKITLLRIEMEDLKKNIIHEIKNRIEDMVRNEVNKLSGELTERQGAAAPMSRKKMLDIIAGAEKISAAQKTMLDAIAAQEKKLGAAHEQKILEIGAAHEKMLRASQAKMLNMLRLGLNVRLLVLNSLKLLKDKTQRDGEIVAGAVYFLSPVSFLQLSNKLTFWFSSLAQRHGLHEALQLLLIKLFSVDCSIFIMFFGAL
ncbi:hypothetical protein LWI28_008616 [Acer negundo]|uniref:Uncharacterized protein n=1 Tax=Acer negundo TaxID=4023 RepID=A0AAD5IIU2_ACENE|nr:hypothetical protein LWI28_008616 [Acer negundo]